MSKIVAIFSGGLDSTVMVNHLLKQGHMVRTLSIDYGQRHRRELDCALNITQEFATKYSCYYGHQGIDLRTLHTILGGSSQTSWNIDVPLGHYANESMKQTVVPNRNMILLSLAVGFAISTKSEYVAYGAHAGDHAIYPDCRPAFVEQFEKLVALCDYTPPQLYAPFIHLTKHEIALLGYKEGAPMKLSYSCYQGTSVHCGQCGTCVERREAFQLAGIPDPTQYAAGNVPLSILGIAPADLQPFPNVPSLP